MTAVVNVYSNVREYDTDQDVFGNVFEWTVVELTPGRCGWTVRSQSRVFDPNTQHRVFVVKKCGAQ